MSLRSGMNRRQLFRLGAAGVPVLVNAQAPLATGEAIFDGASLRGWTIVDGPDSSFFVDDGAIAVSPVASFPSWLRSEATYENFELTGEFFIRGWTDSGIYIHAPEHGRPTLCGLQIKVFHQPEETPTPQSAGSVFPLVAPSKVNVKSGWNSFRIRSDWPKLVVAINGETVHDLDMEAHPELRYRLRSGHIGIAAASAPCRFRNLRVQRLPAKEQWISLYESAADLKKWTVSEGKPEMAALGHVLRLNGLGHLSTNEKFRDFEFQAYIRAASQHNGGVIFRSTPRGTPQHKHYEIQLHNVEEAHYPTGSLYGFKRASYPRIEDEKWYLFQLIVRDKWCLVRINGENVTEYDRLDNLEEGTIELQAHRAGFWTEFKRVRVKRLTT